MINFQELKTRTKSISELEVLRHLIDEPESPNSFLNSSLNTSCSSINEGFLSHSWHPSSSLNYNYNSNINNSNINNINNNLLINQYSNFQTNHSVGNFIRLNQSDNVTVNTNANDSLITQNLANILANAKIQGLTQEHIGMLLTGKPFQ